MPAPLLTLRAASDSQLVASEVSSERTIEWLISAPEAAARADRAPLQIALVLDRSGSMGGDKLRNVQQAAGHVLDMLDERDQVAVVAYDNEIAVLAPGVALTAAARADIKARIAALKPGGWTDLAGGWLEGCRAIGTRTSEGAVQRALLLTDGMANRGITDPEALTHHARELRLRGVATSTFGVGLDFNERLLDALATQGGGRFYYIERPEQIGGFFLRELGDLLTVLAREAFLTIRVPPGVVLEPLGDVPHERVGDRLRVFLGDLCAGEQRALYTRALTPPDAPGASLILRAELGYADPDGRTELVETQLAFSYVHRSEALRAAVSHELLARAAAVSLAATATQAIALERAGQRQQARALLEQQLAAHAGALPASAQAAYQALAGDVAQGLREDERKQHYFDAYQARQARG